MSQLIRIVHVMPQIGIGGAETQLHALVANSRSGQFHHEVLYYSDSRDDEGLRLYRSTGIPLERVPRDKRRPVRFLRSLTSAIGRRHPDIVHCWLVSGVFWGRLAAMLAGVRYIILGHRSSQIPDHWALRLLERATSRRVHYVANSRACASCVAQTLGVSPERFGVIYNGIDLAPFDQPRDRQWLCNEAGVPPDATIVVKVGRLTPAKNHDLLLRLARLCKGSLPVHFVVVGHGEREAELRELARRMGVEDTVHFLGLRRDVPRILRSSDIFCFTSRYEGFPNALLEAMAAGLPIVSTAFAGAEELITHRVNGCLVEPDDHQAMYEAVSSFVADRDRAAELGRAARLTSESRFSLDRMVEATEAYHRRIVSGELRPGS